MISATSQEILTPVILLVAWTMVMWLWMYITRIPAVKAMGIKLDSQLPRGEQMSTLPANVRWKADNYNHLMEQPTIFYALAISVAILGLGEGINLYCAWAYVIIRVVHSIFQAVVNKIEIRFLLFLLSNIALIIMVVNTLLALL